MSLLNPSSERNVNESAQNIDISGLPIIESDTPTIKVRRKRTKKDDSSQDCRRAIEKLSLTNKSKARQLTFIHQESLFEETSPATLIFAVINNLS